MRDNNNSGLVEVCKDNSWHKVCSSMFDSTAADIVCRQLEFQGVVD